MEHLAKLFVEGQDSTQLKASIFSVVHINTDRITVLQYSYREQCYYSLNSSKYIKFISTRGMYPSDPIS